MTFVAGFLMNHYGRKFLITNGLLMIGFSLLILSFFTYSIIGVFAIFNLVNGYSLSIGTVNLNFY